MSFVSWCRLTLIIHFVCVPRWCLSKVLEERRQKWPTQQQRPEYLESNQFCLLMAGFGSSDSSLNVASVCKTAGLLRGFDVICESA